MGRGPATPIGPAKLVCYCVHKGRPPDSPRPELAQRERNPSQHGGCRALTRSAHAPQYGRLKIVVRAPVAADRVGSRRTEQELRCHPDPPEPPVRALRIVPPIQHGPASRGAGAGTAPAGATGGTGEAAAYRQLAGDTAAGRRGTGATRRDSGCRPRPSWSPPPGWAARRCAAPSRNSSRRASSTGSAARGTFAVPGRGQVPALVRQHRRPDGSRRWTPSFAWSSRCTCWPAWPWRTRCGCPRTA